MTMLKSGLLSRENCVLMVIDVQDGLYGERSDIDRESLDEVVDRVAWVTGLAEALEVPVMAIEENPQGNGPTTERVRSRLRDPSRIFATETFSAPDDVAVHEALTATLADTIVILGMETDVCVTQSAIRARELGWRAAVVMDSTYAPAPAHAVALSRLAAHGIDLVSTRQVFYEWTRSLSEIDRLRTVAPALRSTPGFLL